ncbi:hypothetical protein NESM_000262300 [Novymonas esmeraldas]|uniref:Membrane-associated protein n=1 Tax=Novymonas esmeraldas TaxID=1808958 RepID=A0AAW0FC74_9TRYP
MTFASLTLYTVEDPVLVHAVLLIVVPLSVLVVLLIRKNEADTRRRLTTRRRSSSSSLLSPAAADTDLLRLLPTWQRAFLPRQQQGSKSPFSSEQSTPGVSASDSSSSVGGSAFDASLSTSSAATCAWLWQQERSRRVIEGSSAPNTAMPWCMTFE